MEVPILQACDTTEGWEQGDTTLGESELAIEIAGEREDGTLLKHLLIGDGKPVGPDAKRLRARIDIIAELPGIIAGIKAAIEAEAEARIKADEELAEAISEEAQARVQGDEELAKADQAIADEIDRLTGQLDAYNAAINELVIFITTMLGPFGGACPLITEEGDYLVTEEDDYLVVE
jgi:hypothetical protein